MKQFSLVIRIFSFCLITVLGCISSTNAQQPEYKEQHRPQFHFSPPAHWMNDPNGLVYYEGEYHLFYQYYPGGTVWGPMHWGHALSKDLVHWQNLSIALYPDSLGYIFSGSVVVDHQNTSGFKKGTVAPMIAIFTYHNMSGEKSGKNDFQTQGIAYSQDKGRTWKKFANNPVIKNPGMKDFRDPKVIWHEASKKWILTMAAGNQVRFYRSPDLKNWELSGTFGADEGNHGGVWECPDLMELKTNDGKTSKWVLLVSVGTGAPNGGSGTQYFMGNFDGSVFHNDNEKKQTLWLDYGTDNYAGVTWSNVPGSRKLFLGWMSNWQYAQNVPTKVWRSAMTLPRELSIYPIEKGFRIRTKPAGELNALRDGKPAIKILSEKIYPITTNELELSFDLLKADQEAVGIQLSNQKGERFVVGYDPVKKRFWADRTGLKDTSFSKQFSSMHYAPRTSNSEILKMHLYIDRSSIELFADDGEVVMTDIFFPETDFTFVETLKGKDASTSLTKGIMFTLKSIWH